MGVLDDVAMTTKVKSALLTDGRIGAGDINVDTHDGKVTLRGVVRTDVERQLAEDLTRLEGAWQIENELHVKDHSPHPDLGPLAGGALGRVTTSPGAPRSFQKPLLARIQEAFDADQRVNPHLIRVAVNDDGAVTLSGRQDTTEALAAALEAAERVEGVSVVLNDLVVKPSI